MLAGIKMTDYKIWVKRNICQLKENVEEIKKLLVSTLATTAPTFPEEDVITQGSQSCQTVEEFLELEESYKSDELFRKQIVSYKIVCVELVVARLKWQSE